MLGNVIRAKLVKYFANVTTSTFVKNMRTEGYYYYLPIVRLIYKSDRCKPVTGKNSGRSPYDENIYEKVKMQFKKDIRIVQHKRNENIVNATAKNNIDRVESKDIRK